MKLIGMTGMICLVIILAGCGPVQDGSSRPQEINDSEEVQSVTESATAVPVGEAGSGQVQTNDELGEEVAGQIVPEVAEDNSSASRGLAVVPYDLLPQPENELADGDYGWNQLLPRDGIAPIYDPEFVPANEAPYDDNELVIGVEINGEAKAYAIGPLNSREMVNDTVGGVPILVTW